MSSYHPCAVQDGQELFIPLLLVCGKRILKFNVYKKNDTSKKS